MNWSDDERRIFEFVNHDGKKYFADPLKVQRLLLINTNGKIDDLIDEHRRGLIDDLSLRDEEKIAMRLVGLAAEEKIIDAVRHAFSLPDFDDTTGQGANDTYCLSLLNKFLDWFDEKKTNSVIYPTMPHVMEESDHFQQLNTLRLSDLS